jgi:hypothetical protein
MTTYQYMSGRQKWKRPQAMLWSDTPGNLVYVDPLNQSLGTAYVPSGIETYANFVGVPIDEQTPNFLILSDHNRGEINISTQRIEKRQRMINGTMRSVHIADKLSISTSWTNLPSRQSGIRASFNPTTGEMPALENVVGNTEDIVGYTADMGAGGVEMLKWYEDHKGPFWVFLAYDKYTNFGPNTVDHEKLNRYNQIVQMYISAFDYSIIKRGGPGANLGNTQFKFGYDMWNVNVTLEEV